MLAAVLATIPTFEMVFLSKNNVAFLGSVKILGVQFGLAKKVVHEFGQRNNLWGRLSPMDLEDLLRRITVSRQ
jgi:hypothetical protein